MSRSPRKLLSRAVDALREMEDVLSRYPQADADVRATLGDEGLAEVRQARDVLARAAERLGASSGSASANDELAPIDDVIGGEHERPAR